jgi:peptidoglycan/LPS O-acetylase OafA/YrhL
VNARADRFPLMDSLRAIAALSVLTIHIALPSGLLNPGSRFRPYWGRLDVGVAVFFLISGFLLYRPFVRARARGQAQPATGAYAWRRALRIVPAYWLVLTVVALAFSLSYVFTGRGLWTYYGFAQIYSDKTTLRGVSQAWTLCIEVTFYAFLPVWAWLVRRVGLNELAGCALLFAVGVAWKYPFLAGHSPVPQHTALRALPAYLDHFAIGMALAVLSVRWEGGLPRRARWLETHAWIPWLFAAGAFVLVSRGIGLDGGLFQPVNPREYLLRHELYAMVGLGLMAPAIFGSPDRGFIRRRILGNHVLLWLGLISYGIYLWHQAIARWIYDAHLNDHLHSGRPFVWWGLTFAGAVVAAAISYYAMERPLLRLKNLVGPRPAPPDEAIVEPAPAAPPVPTA